MLALKNFKCIKDKEIQDFLNNKAIEYEKRNWGRTYLFLNNSIEKLLKREENFKIEGYITLSFKGVNYPEEISNNLKKKINKGLNKKINPQDCFPALLIGQLGKYIDEDYISFLRGKDMLELAFYLTRQADIIAPLNCVILDTRKNEKINKFYEENGFKLLNKEEEFDTFIKIV